MAKAGGRIEKAARAAAEKGLSGLVVFSGGTLSILRPSYLYYVTGCRPAGPRTALVVNAAGAVAIIVEPPWDAYRWREETDIGDVRPASDFCADLGRAMSDLGLAGRVGIIGAAEMASDVYNRVAELGRPEGADGIVEEMAREKGPEEIEIARTAGKLADKGFNAFLEYAKPGVREYELASEVEYAMRAGGADDIFILLSTGPHNDEMHEPTDRRLRKGDIVIGEITPVCDGLFLQLCRTVVLGQPAPVVREKYDLLLNAFRLSVAEVKPGAPAGLMSKTMNRVLSDAGYAEYCYPPYMRARGHGFGVGSIAPGGVIDDDTTKPFETSQIVVVHPNQYLPETGYLACGETFLVTEKGAERLSETETRLYVKEA